MQLWPIESNSQITATPSGVESELQIVVDQWKHSTNRHNWDFKGSELAWTNWNNWKPNNNRRKKVSDCWLYSFYPLTSLYLCLCFSYSALKVQCLSFCVCVYVFLSLNPVSNSVCISRTSTLLYLCSLWPLLSDGILPLYLCMSSLL